MRAGVVGTGALGRHHVRLLAELPEAELVGIYDRDPQAAERVAAEHGAKIFDSLDRLASEVEAMVVAVPTVDHASLGCELLRSGLHVLVEKPIASSLEEADRLLEAAGACGKVLAVGHVEFYNPAVQALVDLGEPPRYVVVERLASFTPRSLDIDVILDLMIHDLQILHALDPSEVAEVRATGVDVLSPRIDIANARIELASGCVANLTASRVSAERVRQLRVFLARRYCSLDYQDQAIKGFRLEEAEEAETPVGRRVVPEELSVEKGEPLRRELECFLARCAGEPAPLVDGLQGRRALATALEVVKTAVAKRGV